MCIAPRWASHYLDVCVCVCVRKAYARRQYTYRVLQTELSFLVQDKCFSGRAAYATYMVLSDTRSSAKLEVDADQISWTDTRAT